MNSANWDHEGFGKRIQEARERHGYSREALAQAVGITADRIERIEASQDTLNVHELVALCKGLHSTPNSLLFNRDDLARTVFQHLIGTVLSSLDRNTLDVIYDVCVKAQSRREAG